MGSTKWKEGVEGKHVLPNEKTAAPTNTALPIATAAMAFGFLYHF